MNHAAIVDCESTRVYQNRNYISSKLDGTVFAILNQTPVWRDERGTLHEVAPAPILALNGYCLDAPDELPAGGMQGAAADDSWFKGRGFQLHTERGRTLKELEDRATLIERLVNKIIAERDAK